MLILICNKNDKKRPIFVFPNSRSREFNEIELEKWKLNQVHVMMLHSCGKHDRNPFLMQIRPLSREELLKIMIHFCY